MTNEATTAVFDLRQTTFFSSRYTLSKDQIAGQHPVLFHVIKTEAGKLKIYLDDALYSVPYRQCYVVLQTLDTTKFELRYKFKENVPPKYKRPNQSFVGTQESYVAVMHLLKLWIKIPEKMRQSIEINTNLPNDYTLPEVMKRANHLERLKSYATLYPNEAQLPLGKQKKNLNSLIQQYEIKFNRKISFLFLAEEELESYVIKTQLIPKVYTELLVALKNATPQSLGTKNLQMLQKILQGKNKEDFILAQMIHQFQQVVQNNFKNKISSVAGTPTTIINKYVQQFINDTKQQENYTNYHPEITDLSEIKGYRNFFARYKQYANSL